ncbi:MAG: SpoIIIAC/SpoIIIAD family protein [Lachnospiraceae bacterium]
MDIIQITIIAVLGVISTVILKNYKPELAVLLLVALSFLLMGKGITLIGEIQLQLEQIKLFYSDNQYYYKILFKIIGITYLCEFASGICKDAGYQSISAQVELLGKMMILVSGMPILVTIIEALWQYKI